MARLNAICARWSSAAVLTRTGLSMMRLLTAVGGNELAVTVAASGDVHPVLPLCANRWLAVGKRVFVRVNVAMLPNRCNAGAKTELRRPACRGGERQTVVLMLHRDDTGVHDAVVDEPSFPRVRRLTSSTATLKLLRFFVRQCAFSWRDRQLCLMVRADLHFTG